MARPRPATDAATDPGVRIADWTTPIWTCLILDVQLSAILILFSTFLSSIKGYFSMFPPQLSSALYTPPLSPDWNNWQLPACPSPSSVLSELQEYTPEYTPPMVSQFSWSVQGPGSRPVNLGRNAQPRLQLTCCPYETPTYSW